MPPHVLYPKGYWQVVYLSDQDGLHVIVYIQSLHLPEMLMVLIMEHLQQLHSCCSYTAAAVVKQGHQLACLLGFHLHIGSSCWMIVDDLIHHASQSAASSCTCLLCVAIPFHSCMLLVAQLLNHSLHSGMKKHG